MVSLLIMSPALRGSIVHGGHARVLLAGGILEQAAEDLRGDVAGDQAGREISSWLGSYS